MKVIIRLINLLILTALAAIAVDIFYNSISLHYAPLEASSMVQPEIAHSSSSMDFPRDYYHVIVERDLFKVNQPISQKIEPIVSNLEETSLDIKLWGTVTGTNDLLYAVIEAKGDDNRRRQTLLKEGDRIESAMIEKIMRDKIILNLNGHNQVLILEKFQSKGRSRYPSRAVQGTRTAVRTQRRLIRRAHIDKAAGNIGDLMTQAQFVPHREGMRILSIKPRSIFRRMGLRNGDVLTGVDERSIHSIDDALSIYNGLKNSAELSLQIKRRGRPYNIKYMIR